MKRRDCWRAWCIALAWCAAAASGASAQQPSEAGAVACVAIPLATAETVGVSSTDAAAALRALMMSYLTGPSIRSLALDARLPAQAVEEARLKNCSYVLTSKLTQKHHSGGGATLGRMLGDTGAGAAWGIPGGGVAGSIARGAAISGAEAAGALAGATKAKDEFRLEYTLQNLEGKVLVPTRTQTKKADTDGEDVLTPMVERAAGEVAAAVAKK